MTVRALARRHGGAMNGAMALAPATIAPVSLAGIALALGACAAVWLSAGTGAGDIRGVFALAASYLVARAAMLTASRAANLPPTMRRKMLRPGVVPVGAADIARAGWLIEITCRGCECAVYAGLAVGAAVRYAPQGSADWALATGTVGVVGVLETIRACGGATADRRAETGNESRNETGSESGKEWRTEQGTGAAVSRAARTLLGLPYGARVAVIAVAVPVWGPQAALLALADGALVAIGFLVATRTPEVRAVQPWPPPGLLRCRDDGAVARALGRLVRGQIAPLAPAVIGLAATSMLAFVGLGHLPWFLALAPAVVAGLAAPGSANPHSGQLGWTTPAVLLATQCVYIGALGFADGLPAPVTYLLCAAIVLRYADLAWDVASGGRAPKLTRAVPKRGGRDLRQPSEHGTGLGWEGRMVVAGFGAAVGVGTVAYLALAVYQCALICWNVSGAQAPQDGRPSDRDRAGGRSRPAAPAAHQPRPEDLAGGR